VQFTQVPQPTPQTIVPKKKNSLIGLWVTLSVIGFCAFCGLFGAIQNKNRPQIENQTKKETNLNNNSNVQTTPTPPPTFAEIKAKAQSLLKRDNDSIDELKEFDDVMQPLKAITKDSKDFKEAQVLNKKLIDKVSVIAAEKIVLGNRPENSAWDGSVRAADRYLKDTLNDYSSAEYISWTKVAKIYIGKEPFWVTRAKIRAKNGFGAFIVKDITFYIRNDNVVKVEGL